MVFLTQPDFHIKKSRLMYIFVADVSVVNLQQLAILREDGRKKGRTSSPAGSDLSFRQGTREKISPAAQYGQAPIPEGQWDSFGQRPGFQSTSDHGISPMSHPPQLASASNGHTSTGERSNSSASETPYTTVHYHRHLGPTAIAPGHKAISLKVVPDSAGDNQKYLDPLSNNTTQVTGHAGRLPIFDPVTGLPVKALLPHLLDCFYTYYADNYLFLSNRQHLETLIEQGKASIFLICVIAALSSRFCSEDLFKDYLPPKADGSERKAWELSAPFLERAKLLMITALDLPSPDVVAGLLMMAFVDFGNNNEAGTLIFVEHSAFRPFVVADHHSGLWMFTGMAVRMVIEIGLHREKNSLDVKEPTAKVKSEVKSEVKSAKTSSNTVTQEQYERSCQVILFWAVYSLDVSLCNGTGRVPGLKRHEINLRLPNDEDVAVIRAGPGRYVEETYPEVYPHTARMMLSYAQSIDFLNTRSRQIRFQPPSDIEVEMDQLEKLKGSMIEEYRMVPKEIGFGANQYQAAVKAGQAGPYLLLHLQYHLQLAFLTQESLAGEEEKLRRAPDRSVTVEEPIDRRPGLDVRKVNQELYRMAIKAITDMLTFAKLIDDRALLTTVYANQAFFHAACAYSRDMVQNTMPRRKGDTPSAIDKKDEAPLAFPIPNETSPSMVFQFDDFSQYPKNLVPRRASQAATESTYSFLALIAKANYQFLRQAIKDQTQIYAGSGWVDAVLDQREKGLRDVDLSVVSDSISTFIRLHDLREPGGSEAALKKFAPPSIGREIVTNPTVDDSFSQFSYDFLADTDLNFDPQAFFSDYMYTGRS
ncbi:hypothetical protein ACLMJK_008182 [Lecanora helva]